MVEVNRLLQAFATYQKPGIFEIHFRLIRFFFQCILEPLFRKLQIAVVFDRLRRGDIQSRVGFHRMPNREGLIHRWGHRFFLGRNPLLEFVPAVLDRPGHSLRSGLLLILLNRGPDFAFPLGKNVAREKQTEKAEKQHQSHQNTVRGEKGKRSSFSTHSIFSSMKMKYVRQSLAPAELSHSRTPSSATNLVFPGRETVLLSESRRADRSIQSLPFGGCLLAIISGAVFFAR